MATTNIQKLHIYKYAKATSKHIRKTKEKKITNWNGWVTK